MSLEYQIGQVVYSKSGHDQGDVQMICAIEGEYLLLADGRRRKLEKPKRKKKKHVQPTFYVEKDVAAKLQTGEYLLDVVTSLNILTTKTRKVFHHDAVNQASADSFHHSVEVRTLKVCTGNALS